MKTIEEQLRDVINEKYGSLKSFCSSINLPPTTLYSILHRGVLNANIENIKLICKALEIKFDSLAKDKIEFIQAETINDLTIDERIFFTSYRSLTDEQKELVKTLVRQLRG